MKIPRKKDLLKLQKQYKTDKKIGEALGGVPEYLVAYWRRKKKIPPYSAPKFSRKEIEEAWLRHGDDFKAGRELNLSKVAFYSWRRKYGISEKPTHLKLEQLELRFTAAMDNAAIAGRAKGSAPAPTTLKLWRRMAQNSTDGQLTPDWHFREHNGPKSGTGLFELYSGLGMHQDGNCPDHADTKLMRPPVGQSLWGDCLFGRTDWQLIENRIIRPGETISGCAHELGGLGGIAALCLGENLEQPKAICKVEFARQASHRACVEDRFLDLLNRYPAAEWQDAVLEFEGTTVERLTIDRKIKLTQLATAFGAAAAICPFDEVIRKHFPRNMKAKFIKAFPDRGAHYDREFLLESRLKDVRVGVFDGSWSIHSGEDAAGNEIETIIIGPDALPYEIAYAAEILSGYHIPTNVTVFVMPVSASTIFDSHRRGWLERLVTAGASIVDRRVSVNIDLDKFLGQGDVLSTRPPENLKSVIKKSRRLWFAGIRTVAATAIRGVITPP